ncbi:MAG TPA: hypothetical protein VIV12_31005 [Streptosporangiaceae bacterium]
MAAMARLPGLRRKAGRRNTLARREARAGLAFISPTLIVVIVVVILPVLWTIMLSFQHIKLLNIRYAGIFGSYTLNNFRHVLASPDFVSSLVTRSSTRCSARPSPSASAWSRRSSCAARSAAGHSCADRCWFPTSRRSWP